MYQTNIMNETSTGGIKEIIAETLAISQNSILPYADSYQMLIELLGHYSINSSHLVFGGLANPDVLLAADQAHFSFTEAIGNDPFIGSTRALLDAIKASNDLVYLGNPNTISGANYSLKEIEAIAHAIPGGLLLVDEYYFDFYGITALPLVNLYNNIVVIRNFTAAYGSYANSSGALIGCENLINELQEQLNLRPLQPLLVKTIINALQPGPEIYERLKELHDEALRLTKQLNRLGIQSRITPGDFILVKVASPKDCGNYLNSKKIAVENLDGYPLMKKYLKYRLETSFTNDRFIDAFRRMPKSYYQLSSKQLDKITLKNPGETRPFSFYDDLAEYVEQKDEILTTK